MVLYIALGSSVSTHPGYGVLSKIGLSSVIIVTWSRKMKIGKSVFLPNTIFRFFFSFYIADPISVKLRNRAVSRTNVTLSGVNRSYRTFYAPSLLRTPPLQCCRRAGERRNVHCPYKARLSAKTLLIWKWSFILTQIKLVFKRKVLHLPRFESERFWNSEMAHYC